MKRHLLSAALMLCAPAAHAQSNNCAPREVVLQRLSETFGERRQSIALSPGNTVVEVFAARETGSWSIIVTRPDGISCLIAAGQGYEALDDTLPPQV